MKSPSLVVSLNPPPSSKLPGKKGSGTQSPPLKVGKDPGTGGEGWLRQDFLTLLSKHRELVSQCGVDRSGGHQNPDLG